MKVVADFGRGAGLPANRKDEFAFVCRLDYVIQRIVLKDHRRSVTAEEFQRQFRTFTAETSERNRQLCLDADINLKIGCAIRRDDSSKTLQQVCAQTFGKALATDYQIKTILRQIESCGINESLDKRRIAKYQISISCTEKLKRVFEFLLIRTYGFQNSYVHQRHRHIHPGCPWTQRKTVEQHTSTVAINQLIIQLKNTFDVVALLNAADPVVGDAG